MIKKLLVALALCWICTTASAGGLFSEIGGGFKLEDQSSWLMSTKCKSVLVIDPEWPRNPRGGQTYHCGGDNPVFVGWVLGWEFKNERTKIGLFHQSQWLDNDGEIHFNCICASHKFYWGRR